MNDAYTRFACSMCIFPCYPCSPNRPDILLALLSYLGSLSAARLMQLGASCSQLQCRSTCPHFVQVPRCLHGYSCWLQHDRALHVRLTAAASPLPADCPGCGCLCFSVTPPALSAPPLQVTPELQSVLGCWFTEAPPGAATTGLPPLNRC
jgi:hypothetical protein